MSILSLLVGRETEDDMARAKPRPADPAIIADYLRDLKRCVHDRSAFEAVRSRLEADKTLSAGEVINIASAFAHGLRAKSKKAALVAISQERMRLANAAAKAASAAKARTW